MSDTRIEASDVWDGELNQEQINNKTIQFISHVESLKKFVPRENEQVIYLGSYFENSNEGFGFLIYDSQLSSFDNVLTFKSDFVSGGFKRFGKNDKIYATWAGFRTDKTGAISVENTEALQRAYNATVSLKTVSIDVSVAYINTVNIRTYQVVTEGRGLTSLYINRGHELTFEEACEFKNINFFANNADMDTPVLRDDRALKLQDGQMRLAADVDVVFDSVGFLGNANYFVYIKGRGIECIDCVCSSNIKKAVFKLDFPRQEEIFYPPWGSQTQAGEVEAGFRGFKFVNFRNHGADCYIVENTGYNQKNCFGIQFANIWLEGLGRVLKGYSKACSVNGIYGHRMTTKLPIFDLTGIDSLLISGVNIVPNRNGIESESFGTLVNSTGAVRRLTVSGIVSSNVRTLIDINYSTPDHSQDIDLSNLIVSTPSSKIFSFNAPATLRFFKTSGYCVAVNSDYQPFSLSGGATCEDYSIDFECIGSSSAVHNFNQNLKAKNGKKTGGFVGTGIVENIYIGFKPKLVKVFNSQAVIVGMYHYNNGNVVGGVYATPTGFSVSATIASSGTNLIWELNKHL